MANKQYLDYAGLKRVLAKLLPGARKIWHGTQAEWDALSAAEKAKYDQAEISGVNNDGMMYVADKVESGNMNAVTSNAVAGNTVVGEYVTTKAISVPVNATPVNYLKINLKKGKWIVHARVRTDISNEANVLVSMYFSTSPDVTQGLAAVDQRAQLPGIWHFVSGFLPMTLEADAILYVRLSNSSTVDAITTIEGTVYAMKVSD